MVGVKGTDVIINIDMIIVFMRYFHCLSAIIQGFLGECLNRS